VTSEHKRILRAIKQEDVIEYAKALIKIPSNTGQEEDIARVLADLMSQIGMKDVKSDDMWNVYGRIKGAGRKRSILLASHTDTGPAGSMADAYEPKIMNGSLFGKHGDVIRGRGAISAKGHIAAALAMAKALIDSGATPECDLIIAGYARDLLGNHDGIRGLLEHEDVRPGLALISEPVNNRILVGARGRVEFDVELEGKQVHAGTPEGAINPIYKMAKFLNVVQKVRLPSHDKLGNATLSPIGVECKVNRPNIPYVASATFDRRTIPGESPQTVMRDITELCEDIRKIDSDFKHRSALRKAMFAFEVSLDDPLVTLMQEAGQIALNRKLEIAYSRSFSSDAGFLQSLRIPSAGFGPGRIEDMAEEHVEVKELMDAARVYATLGFLHSAR